VRFGLCAWVLGCGVDSLAGLFISVLIILLLEVFGCYIIFIIFIVWLVCYCLCVFGWVADYYVRCYY